MKIERIDHVHIKCTDFEKKVKAFEEILGKEFPMKQDMTEEHGNLVAFDPFPIGLELMKSTANKGSGALTAAAPEGAFTVTLKVTDIREASAEMVAKGYRVLERYDMGPIQEVVFDTVEATGVLIELVEYAGDSMFAAYGG